MTGRELIVCILENNLEDQEVFRDGKIIGYVTVDEAALFLEVGRATVTTWINIGLLDKCIVVDGDYLIPIKSLKNAKRHKYVYL